MINNSIAIQPKDNFVLININLNEGFFLASFIFILLISIIYISIKNLT